MNTQSQKPDSGLKTIIIIGSIFIVLGFLSSIFFSQTIDKFFWQVRTQSIFEEVRSETHKYLSKDTIINWREATSSAQINQFALAIKNSSPLIVGLKIYNPEALVVWSDLRSVTVGTQEDRVLPELKETTLDEQVVDTAEASVKAELEKENLLEVYTSIKTRDGDIIGFVETYFDATELNAFIQKVDFITWGTLVIVSGIIFSILRFSFRKRNEIILTQSRELHDIIANSPIGVCTTYPEGTIISVNPKLLQICGITDEKALINSTIFKNEIIKEMGLDRTIREALLGAPFEAEGHFIKNGLTRYVRFRGTPIFIPDTKIVERFLITVEDITKRKRLEDELTHHTLDLETKVSERTQSLEHKVAELEQFQRVTVDRELRMTELKKQIEQMRIKLESLGVQFNEEDYRG